MFDFFKKFFSGDAETVAVETAQQLTVVESLGGAEVQPATQQVKKEDVTRSRVQRPARRNS